MRQRFSEEGQRVIDYTKEEAMRFGEGYASTEHMLLGLVRDPNTVAAKTLAAMGIGLSRVRAEVEKQLPRGDARPTPDMLLTPRCRRAIDLADDESTRMNNDYIGPEHLLLGLIRETDGLGSRVLTKFGCKVDLVRDLVAKIQAGEELPGRPLPRSLPAAENMAAAFLTIRHARHSADLMTYLLLRTPPEAISRELAVRLLRPSHVTGRIERRSTQWAIAAPSPTLHSVWPASGDPTEFLLTMFTHPDFQTSGALQDMNIDTADLATRIRTNP